MAEMATMRNYTQRVGCYRKGNSRKPVTSRDSDRGSLRAGALAAGEQPIGRARHWQQSRAEQAESDPGPQRVKTNALPARSTERAGSGPPPGAGQWNGFDMMKPVSTVELPTRAAAALCVVSMGSHPRWPPPDAAAVS